MSKVQAALQKVAADRERAALKKGDHPTPPVPPPSGPGGRVSGSDGLTSKTRVSVDFDALIDSGVVVADEHKKELRDSMRRIKWPVLANAFGEQSSGIPRGNVVMVASATAGEGKTFTTVNLALSIAAEKDYDVLLVDADIAKPHASEAFGLVWLIAAVSSTFSSEKSTT